MIINSVPPISSGAMRFFLILFAFLLTSCETGPLDKVDPVAGLSREDYRELREPRMADKGPPIPRIPYKFNAGSSSPFVNDKIVTLSVTEKVPLKDVLRELASKADVNLELDPNISGGVIFSATRQPFSKVLERLCNMAALRYSYEDGFLRVERDEPSLKSYSIEYLTLIRKAKSEMGIATNVFSSVQSGGRNNASASSEVLNGNNSTTKVEANAIADFWAEVETNIDFILVNTRSARSLLVNDKTLQQKMQDEGISPSKPFSVNRQAGILTIFGTDRQHKAIDAYIARLKRSTGAQVMIDARIIEVELSEGYRSGINWRSLFGGAVDGAARFGAAAAGAPFATAGTATDGVVTLSLNDSDFAGILNFVRSFGTARTLSSPRLTVLNNQPAVLKVARNEVYFTSTIETTPIIGSAGGSPVAVQRTVNSTPNTVPVGFLMTVQPAINLEKDEVTLNLRPTVSFIVDRVEDPGVKIAAADANVPEVTSSIPVVAVREMDSVLSLKSGTVAVMGGLMQDTSGNLENGIPFADEVPLAGNLAKSRKNDAKLSELVILLRATIVGADGAAPDEADKEIYHKFARDRRPMPVPLPAVDDTDGENDDSGDEPEQEAEPIKEKPAAKQVKKTNKARTSVDKKKQKKVIKKKTKKKLKKAAKKAPKKKRAN